MNIERFIKAQQEIYQTALQEIKNGQKTSHWMWYIFPQIEGLGESTTSKYYAIKNLEEAKKYLQNEQLKNNLIEITKELLKHDNIKEILGYTDYLKLKSSMTLFNIIEPNTIFQQVLDKYYNSQKDELTLLIIKSQKLN